MTRFDVISSVGQWSLELRNTVHLHFVSFAAVIQALTALVSDPEPEHPLRGDLAEEFTKDRSKFNKNAKEYTLKFAEKRPQ